MARVTPSGLWTALDDVPGRNLRAPRADHVAAAIRAMNHTAAYNERTLFCQSYGTNAANTPTVADPMCRFRYNQNYVNGRRLRHRALFFPPFTAEQVSGTAIPTVRSGVGNELTAVTIDPSPEEPTELRHGQWTEDITPAIAYANRTIGTLNAFKLRALAVHETLAPSRILDTDWGASIDTGRGPSGLLPITDTLLIDLRALEDALWLQQRPIVASWCAPGFTNPDALGGGVTGVAYPTVRNLIDLTLAAADVSAIRTATTPGEICPAQYAGRGAVNSVIARCAVYAQMSAGTGTVAFAGSLQPAGTVTAAVTTTAGWFASASDLLLDTSIEYDKVDMLGAPDNAANTLYVWAWMIQIEPA